MKVVITGGHHSSALPVIKKLREKDSGVEIFWIGHKYSMKGDTNPTLEYREITSLGIPFYDLKAGKLYKTYDIGRLLKIPYGFIQSFYLLLKIKPNIILSFGGYIAAPVVVSGSILKIPSITHEQTVVSGYANKLVSVFAKKVMISWRESEKYFPKRKVIYTGIPLRKSIFEIKSNSFSVNNNLPTVYISAGKTGSHIINNLVKESLEDLLGFCNIIHQTGDNSVNNDYNQLQAKYESIKDKVKGKYFLRKFVFDNEIGEAFNKSDLVLSRSGAHTISEILALKKPCILIPIPWVSHNEQNKNAEMLRGYGLAGILNQGTLDAKTLENAIKNSLANLDKYKLNNNEALSFIKEDPAEKIANEVIKYSKNKKRQTN
ncbi:MAG: UDP-N-acetylglucosamine--N-acetylmuramyl-(pentapeptide) pyrophosphoryl-undecaprenol N-acetylglucosamine transferase [Patescibacteria group bacterium]